MTIKAIPTEYNGYRFRSRLEARWAVFFDKLGIDYEYEIEGYEVANGVWYLPDFHLESGWIEVKHKNDTDIEATEKMGLLVSGLREPGVIVYGDPLDHYAVLFLPHFVEPGYVRHFASFDNLNDSHNAALIARQAQFEHGASHAR